MKTKKDIKIDKGKPKTKLFSLKKIASLFLVIILLSLSYSLSRSLYNTFTNHERIEKEKKERDILKEEVALSREKVSYFETENYLEKEGRDKLGLLKEGEKVIIFPDEKIKEINVLSMVENKEIENKELPNWEKWLNFLEITN